MILIQRKVGKRIDLRVLSNFDKELCKFTV